MSTNPAPHAIPPDFLRALRRAGLHEFFQRGAFVHRAGYLSWIGAASRPETRRRKIREAVDRLRTQWREELAMTGGLRPTTAPEAAWTDFVREQRRSPVQRSA